MDRIEAMKVFITALDEGSLAGAARRLGKSPAAVSRAIAFLENHVGVELLHRSTRSIRLSEAGEPYAAVCRRVLLDLDEADLAATGGQSMPSGLLTITAPVAAGESIVQPIIEAYLAHHPGAAVRLHLFDRPANLIDEGIDLALRLAELPDSTLIATRVGEVRRVVAAAPGYLDSRPPIGKPADLAAHDIVAMTHFGIDSWSFPSGDAASPSRTVSFSPRFVVNSIRAAGAAAGAGRGVTRLFSYHVADELRAGTLRLVLARHEHPPLPVHLIAPRGRMQVPKVRAFVDLAVPRLREIFGQVSADIAAIDDANHRSLA